MKYLCVCNGGNCRSVAVAEMLKGTYGHEAISAGTYWLSRDTMKMLCDWADLIVPVEAQWSEWMPPEDTLRWRSSIIWDARYDAKRKVFATIFKDVGNSREWVMEFVKANIKGIL